MNAPYPAPVPTRIPSRRLLPCGTLSVIGAAALLLPGFLPPASAGESPVGLPSSEFKEQSDVRPEPPRRPPNAVDVSFDYVAPASYRGTVDVGKFSIYSLQAGVSHDFQVADWLTATLGAGWRSLWLDGGAPLLPQHVGSVNARFGLRMMFSEKWSALVLGNVGIYSDWEDVSAADWNFDIAATVGYNFSRDLSVFAGVAIFPQFQIPILPAVGVRWKISDRWALNLVMPKPLLEYEFAPGWKVYGFGQLAGGRFRVGQNFGDDAGRPSLNGRWLSFLDIRAGGGLAWSPVPWATVRAEAGSSLYREFEYDGAGFSVRAGPAAYASAGVGLRF